MNNKWSSLVRSCCAKALLCAEAVAPIAGIPILLYHRISPNIGPNDVHSNSPEEFERQLAWLKLHGYQTISLDEVLTLRGIEDASRYVAITFDDGHYDNLIYAAPLLRRYGMRATVFVVSDFVGRDGWLQQDGTFREEGGGVQRWSMLSWDNLRSMADVFEVGVHGRTHASLPSLSDTEIARDLNQAREVIAREMGVRPTFYCYPYGVADDRSASAVAALGFAGACEGRRGLNRPDQNPFRLRRNIVGYGVRDSQFALLMTEYVRVYNFVGRAVRM